MTPETKCRQIDSMCKFLGKTIQSVNDECCNCLEIKFTDNTELRIEVVGQLTYELWVPINQKD